MRTKPKAEFWAFGDLHLSESRPIARKDDLVEGQFKKLERAFRHIRFLNRKTPNVVLFPGDVFDKWKMRLSFYLRVMRFFQYWSRKKDFTFVVIYGNHDLPQQSWQQRVHSPVCGLGPSGAGVVVIADHRRPVVVHGVKIYGFAHGVSYPTKPYRFAKDDAHTIVMVHRYIHPIGKPGEYMPDTALSPKELWAMFPDAPFIVGGDNHAALYAKNENYHYVVNAGCVTRRSRDTRSFRPRFYHLRLDRNEIKTHYLRVDRNVFKSKAELGLSVKQEAAQVSDPAKLDELLSILSRFEGAEAFEAALTAAVRNEAPDVRAAVESAFHSGDPQ